jgi:hypothetical protein
MKRLVSAYRALWDWRCGVIGLVLLAVIVASTAGLLVGAIALSPRSPLTLVAAGILIPAVLLLHFAPGDDESDGAQ